VLPPETGAFAAAFTHGDTITARLAGVDVGFGARSAAASLGRSAAKPTLAELARRGRG